MFFTVNERRGLKRGKKGFTLVELLIVVIVIGVLSAMMIIAANEIMATSRAATVISNLRNLKSAVTLWYIDNQDKIFKHPDSKAYLVKYNGYESPIQELWESRDNKNYRDTSGFKTEVLHYLNNAQNVGVSGGGYADANNKKSAAVTSNAYRLNDNGGKNARDQWFIGYVISDGKGAGNNILKRKFAGRAKSLGLLQTNNKNSAPYTDGDVVWMMVLQL